MSEIMNNSHDKYAMKKSIYKNYINAQREEYKRTLEELNSVIEKLKAGIVIKGKLIRITGDIKIEGRIKSYCSAMNNDINKTVDDCFGIRIITENQTALMFIREIIKRLDKDNSYIRDMNVGSKIKVVGEKDHAERKDTEYNAIHQMIVRDEKNPNSPLVELQYWDREIENRCTYGDLNHNKYKREDYMAALNGEIGDELPEFYEINSKGEAVRLPKEKVIRKMFPNGAPRNDSDEIEK